MSSGFRYVLAGACAIALLFTALSLWSYLPQMDIVWTPRGAVSTPVAPAPATASSNPAAAQPAPRGGAASGASLPARPVANAQASAQLSNQLTLHSPAAGALSAVTPLDSDAPELWLLTTANAVVCNKPGGDPLLAPSVSHAPLTVFSGSYLREVRRESGWVLILSPSKTLGWVHERQVRQVDM